MSEQRGGWTEAVDPKTGKTYYYNKSTKAVQWKKPADYDAGLPASQSSHKPSPSSVEAAGDKPEAPADDPDNNPAFWAEVVDPKTQKKYYYNKKTKKTSWKRPPCLAESETLPPSTQPTLESANSPAKTPSPLPPGWVEAIDSRTNRTYWYNKATRQTSWKRPLLDPDSATPSSATVSSTTTTQPTAASQTEASSTTKPSTTESTRSVSPGVDATPASTSTSTSTSTSSSLPPSQSSSSLTLALNSTTTNTSSTVSSSPLVSPSSPTMQASTAAETALKAADLSAFDSDNEEDKQVEKQAKREQEEQQAKDNAAKRAFMDDSDDENEDTDKTTNNANKNTRSGSGNGSDGTSPSPLVSSGSSRDVNEVLKRAMRGEDEQDEDGEGDGDEDVDGDGDEEGKALSSNGGNEMIKVKQAQQELLLLRDSDSDDDDGQQIKLTKNYKGFLKRFLRQKKDIQDSETVLSFKKSMIHKALLKQNRELDTQCVQLFKNIMSYMGDRSSSKGPVEHAKKIIRNIMVAPSGLRDEAFVQLKKQTTKHPKKENCEKGWELLSILLSTLPPSKTVRTFITDHINRTIDTKDTPESTRQIASRCLKQIDRICALGQRKQVPSCKELDAIKLGKPLVIEVPLLNGDVKVLEVDSYTTVAEVEKMVTTRLNLSFLEPFGLFEVGAANVERHLEAKERIADVLASWENEPPDAEVNKTKGYVYKSLYSQLLYKAKLVLKLNVPEIASDPEAINLLYMQAVNDVVTDRYPIKEKDSVVLAALQLQATHGDHKPSIHTPEWLASNITQYLPEVLLCEDVNKSKKPSPKLCAEWAEKIMSRYKKFTGFTQLEARSSYLQVMQGWSFYGATFFPIEQKQFKDYPDILYIGITCEGVLLMHPQKRTVLECYPYPDILTWGYSDEKFIVTVGNLVQQRKLIFKTTHGSVINSLVHDYVKFKIRTRTTTTQTISMAQDSN